jgi:hypothetical protein
MLLLLMKSLFLAAAMTLAASSLAHAQGPSTGGPAPGTPAVDVPLDGGASLLLASGLALGLKKLRQHRRK